MYSASLFNNYFQIKVQNLGNYSTCKNIRLAISYKYIVGIVMSSVFAPSIVGRGFEHRYSTFLLLH